MLRPGLWAEDSQDCQFDANQAPASWPACAPMFVVVDGKSVAGFDRSGQPAWAAAPYLIAAGNPWIVQLHLADTAWATASYYYLAALPPETDAQGRIIAIRGWLVQCGPPPPARPPGVMGGSHFGTTQPLVGITMDRDHRNCTTDSPEDARLAARAALAWTDPNHLAKLHWVRDGDH